MKILCIYLGEGRGGEECTNACIYMETHSQHLLQNHLMDVYHGPHMRLGFLSDPLWGGSKAGQEGFKESFKD